MQLVKFREKVSTRKGNRSDGKPFVEHKQGMHVLDRHGDTIATYQVDVSSEAGNRPGIYELNELCWAQGDFGTPQLDRYVADKADFVASSWAEMVKGAKAPTAS